MLFFPNCKINLGLNVVARRDDGYHNLETVFYPVKLLDALEVLKTSGTTTLEVSGKTIDCSQDDNLCIKAYRMLKADFEQIPSVNILLYKNIPSGAGLGGGSADGAFTLLLLNKKFKLGLSQEKLVEYALRLGSDCPFFIINSPSFAASRGEKLEPCEVNLQDYNIVLVSPGIHIATATAFKNIEPKTPQQSAREIVKLPPEKWKHLLSNDFEGTVFSIFPKLKRIKEQLYASGAVYASMTGTGSTLYGIFPKGMKQPPFHEEYRVDCIPG